MVSRRAAEVKLQVVEVGGLGERHGPAANGQLVAFNPGATLLGPIPGRDGRAYSTSGDVVSALAHTTHRDVRVLTPKEGSDLLSAHGAANFTEGCESGQAAHVPGEYCCATVQPSSHICVYPEATAVCSAREDATK